MRFQGTEYYCLAAKDYDYGEAEQPDSGVQGYRNGGILPSLVGPHFPRVSILFPSCQSLNLNRCRK